jgi:hypothetical protein
MTAPPDTTIDRPDSIDLSSQSDALPQIRRDFTTFQNLVARAETYRRRRRYSAAAAYAQMAATHAFWKHPGQFASPTLERLLLSIGRDAVSDGSSTRTEVGRRGSPQRVLHVLTRAGGVGGHTRMVWRWMEQDQRRSHSVVLTRQGALPVPPLLHEAVRSRNGQVHVLNRRPGNVISWAKSLRKIAMSADVVVLHLFADDVIPMLAFADGRNRPPVLLLDHADHAFWMGIGISDLVIALRHSGMRLAQERRYVDGDRSVLLPIVVPPVERTMTKFQAKSRLGLDKDAVVLLSIARGAKYATKDGCSFPDMLLPVLERHDRAVLLVVGPQHTEEWERAAQRVQGRIRAFGEREDTAVFYQAADIYIDSFPVVSITSLLEAGSYGLPLVTRSPLSGDPSILGADAPGLMRDMIQTRDAAEHDSTLSRLVEDQDLRNYLGRATERQITSMHSGAAWQRTLEDVYVRAAHVPRVAIQEDATDEWHAEEVDTMWSYFFRNELSLDDILQQHMKNLPIDMRIKESARLMADTRSLRPNLLLPEWTTAQVRSSYRAITSLRNSRHGN